ncbi:MAG: hypothetical protein DRG39_02800 [Deltaproteobacteria bacterium]|nr:MAG: hypothetical protein DRG39_02800 [Deltaproteobacteria bacterium]
MLEEYKRIRSSIMGEIGSLKDLFLHINREDPVTALQDVEKKLLENRFHLVVIGQFKRGKSTFINSIIGEKLLPTSVVPLTSIITILRYGDKQRINVILNDGSNVEIKREELTDWVTEEGNPRNEKNVKEVEIYYPSDYLKDGICLIDTPGVGSIFQNNTEVTYGYLSKIDAAIFLVSADPPISQSELSFLNDVRDHVEKLFFVLNKIDYLDEDELEESLRFTKKTIEDALDMEDSTIYPISAKLALQGRIKKDDSLIRKSRIKEFYHVLNDFLLRAKGQIVLKKAISDIRSILAKEEMAFELESKAISAPLGMLEDKIKKFTEKMQDIRQDKEDTYYYFEGEIKRVIDILDRDLARLKESSIKRLLGYADELGRSYSDRPASQYAKDIEAAIDQEIIEIFDEWIIKEEERLNKEYFRVSKRFSERTNEIIDAILDLSEDLFDIKIDRVRVDEQIERDSSFYYMLGEPPKFFGVESAFDFFSKRLFPARLSKGLALRDLKKKVPEKVDKTCGRVRWDFMDRIKRSFMDFRWELNKKIEETEENITKAISRAMELRKKSAKEIEKAEKDLLKILNDIRYFKKRMENISLQLPERI